MTGEVWAKVQLAMRCPIFSRFGISFGAALTGASLFAASRAPFLSPEEALKTFQLEPGLRIELVVAEPLVVDPVAFAFDDQRRLYVAENRGYPGPVRGSPTTPDAVSKPEGRIALLEDTD